MERKKIYKSVRNNVMLYSCDLKKRFYYEGFRTTFLLMCYIKLIQVTLAVPKVRCRFESVL